MGENDSGFTSKCRQPFNLTVEWLALTSNLHFESVIASFSFALIIKSNMTQRSNVFTSNGQKLIIIIIIITLLKLLKKAFQLNLQCEIFKT